MNRRPVCAKIRANDRFLIGPTAHGVGQECPLKGRTLPFRSEGAKVRNRRIRAVAQRRPDAY
jgi:hypothetical protein